MVENITAVQVLQQLLTDAALSAESWANNLELSTFPMDGKWEDEEVSKHFALMDWRWENWEELGNDIERWSNLEISACHCEEVKDEHARLAAALKVLNNFVEVVGGHSDEFCR